MKSLRTIAFLATLGLAGMADAAEFAPPALFQPPLPGRDSAGGVAFPDGVVYQPGITYKEVTGYRPLKLDLYLPRPGSTPAPLVVWIHGGGFELGNPQADWTWGDWRPVLAELAARGYVVAAVSYRLSAEAPFPAPLQDVQDAIAFVRGHADLWKLDPDRAIVWGLSAGGGLAALAGTAPCQAPAAGHASTCVQGVVDWFGPSEFTVANSASPAIRRELGCGPGDCSAAARSAASALQQVRPGLPPFLIVQGGADPLVTPDQSTRLGAALDKAKVSNQVVVVPGLGHGFSGASPEQLRQILLQTFDGIDRMSGRANSSATPQ